MELYGCESTAGPTCDAPGLPEISAPKAVSVNLPPVTNLTRRLCEGSAILLLAMAATLPLPGADDESSPRSKIAALLETNPLDDGHRLNLEQEAEALIKIAKAQASETKAEQKRIRQTAGLKHLSDLELQRYFHGSPDALTRRDARGLAEIVRLVRAANEAPAGAARDTCLADLREVMTAMRNNRRSPVPEELNLSSPFKFLFRDWRRRVGIGTTLATNLVTAADQDSDPSQREPAASGFWTCPPHIAEQNLYAGFGRDQFTSFADRVCEYDGPKTSHGTRPGFDVECQGTRYQIKFGEVNSEPFTARIFHALGYHVDPTDYAPQVKVRYDRRLLREFNLRQPLTMRVRPLALPLGSFKLQPRHDPFNFILAAVFKDGRRVSGGELKNLLFRRTDAKQPEREPDNFRADVEATLDYLVMSPANVQPKDPPAENLGSWEFGGLGHEHRRELRAAALLAAWLGWSDSRWDNTRLRVAYTNGQARLQFFFTDLGGGMGGATGWFTLHGEDPNELTWTFTCPEIVRGPGQMTTPFRISHFHTLVPTPAFREMTVDDARWMARLIGQITENQLASALIASGYDAAEVKLYVEKLVSRRDQMICDLGLTDEIPTLRPAGVNRQLSFNPATDAPVTVVLNSGERVSTNPTGQAVSNGWLIKNSNLEVSRR
jgi:hypothetical protein